MTNRSEILVGKLTTFEVHYFYTLKVYKQSWRRPQKPHLDAFKVDLVIKLQRTFTVEFDDRKQESAIIHHNAKHIHRARKEIKRSSILPKSDI